MLKLFKISGLTLIGFLLLSCIHEDMLEKESFLGEKEVLAMLEFSHEDFDLVEISTKATLGVVPESRIQNMFMCIFVEGKRVYASYFDADNRYSSLEEMNKTTINCWTVSNKSSDDPNDKTSGIIKIKSPVISGGAMYIIANIDADMVNISPEKLNTVRTESDLQNLTASLNQEITSRNGYFPMSFKTSIDIAGNGAVELGDEIELERLDSKVMVNIRVATDNELETTEDGVTTKQTLKEFVPESWRVVNLPKGTYVFGREQDYDEAGYFSTEPVVFETKGTQNFTYEDSDGNPHTVNSPVNGFSFYMLENREEPKASVHGKYHQRDKRVKDELGQYTKTGDKWVYAPEDGTYLEIKGEVIMTVDVSSEAKQQQLSAATTYYIHLGDFIHSETNDVDPKDNYDIERNTIYNYTITIKGVSEIETEVTTSNLSGVGPNDPEFKENETGATGQVYIAKESIYTFDAHYGQRVFCFDAAYIDPDNVTWYVKTPFGKEGVPEKVGDTEVPAGMDYKWVHFLLNSVEADGTYSHKNLPWPGDPYDDEEYSYYKDFYSNDAIDEDLLMDVVEFTQFIKEEKRKFERNHDDNPDNNVEASKFLKEYDDDWRVWYNEKNGTSIDESQAKAQIDEKYPWWRYRMYVTAFVDEFYYEVDPISGEAREGLWKEFVNQPNRLMHILCDNEKSFDRESSATGSVITLRQRSIQTPYNLENAETAWGCETVDEFRESHFWFFSTDESMSSGVSVGSIGNTSKSNGLYNTARLWTVINSSGEWTDLYWADYLDFNRLNDYTTDDGQTIFSLKEDYAVMRYATMPRNRDNNGNGKIDSDELRWYVSSIEQLQSLYLGELGLSDESRLYLDKYASETGQFTSGEYIGADKWRAHIISSSSKDDPIPIIVWAEEGLSTSNYRKDIEWYQGGPYSIKSVRNLGLDNATADDLKDSDYMPESFIKVISPSDPITSSSVYKFDLRNVNKKSIRFYTTKELEPANEESEMARCYYGFETGDLLQSSTQLYSDIKLNLESNNLPCPKGWRMPNVREGTLMNLHCNSSWWNGHYVFVSTYHSLGEYGLGLATTEDNSGWVKTWSWNVGPNNINMSRRAEYRPTHIRCVKDSDPATW